MRDSVGSSPVACGEARALRIVGSHVRARSPYSLNLVYFGHLVIYVRLWFSATDAITFTEFKEIRKEWKARKKEEENQRKAEEERQRQAAQAAAQNGEPQGPDGPPTSTYPGSRPVTLPPIGYQPTQYPAPPSGSVPQQPMADYQNHMYSNYPPPHSPYGQPNQGMYSQCEFKI